MSKEDYIALVNEFLKQLQIDDLDFILSLAEVIAQKGEGSD